MNEKLRIEIKYLRGMSEALGALADEIEQMKRIDKESEEVYRRIGSDILFRAVAVGWRFEVKDE